MGYVVSIHEKLNGKNGIWIEKEVRFREIKAMHWMKVRKVNLYRKLRE